MGHKCDGCRYKGEHQEMMFRPFGVCTKELNLIDAEKVYNADKCPYKKTNADRIRAMSDEELAALLANETYRIAKPCLDAFGYGLEKQAIYAKRLVWLKQPAE